MKWEKQAIIITGSTRGIGKSTAKQLAQQGAAVVVNGRQEECVNETVDEIRKSGGRAVGVVGCVTDKNVGQQLVDAAVEKFGTVTTLINNAGIIRDKMSYKMKLEEFEEVIDVHVKGTFFTTQPVVQQMRKQGSGGLILNMTSQAGLVGTVGQVNYSAAKAGILGMTWTLAKELEKDAIQVNAISPAALTDMTRPVIEKAQQHAEQKGETLPDYWKIGSVDDVTNYIIDFITFPKCRRSGEVYAVNGKEIGRWLPPSYEML
ncbi:SDR family NAD(P)-dependent oxidoreductase [Bacillus tianshenii]|nr:SDR family NAD(P)-dependent oxidoreductase [Bacillus tianshenii]